VLLHQRLLRSLLDELPRACFGAVDLDVFTSLRALKFRLGPGHLLLIFVLAVLLHGIHGHRFLRIEELLIHLLLLKRWQSPSGVLAITSLLPEVGASITASLPRPNNLHSCRCLPGASLAETVPVVDFSAGACELHPGFTFSDAFRSHKAFWSCLE